MAPDHRRTRLPVSIVIEPGQRIADLTALVDDLNAAARWHRLPPSCNGPLFSVGHPEGRQTIGWEIDAPREAVEARGDGLRETLRRIAQQHGGELTLVDFPAPPDEITEARQMVFAAIGRTRDRAALDGHRGKLFGEAFAQYADWTLLTTARLRYRLLQSVQREARLAAQREAA